MFDVYTNVIQNDIWQPYLKFDFVTVSFSRVQLSCCCVAVGLYIFAAEFLFIAATSKHSAIKEASCTPGRRTPKGTF